MTLTKYKTDKGPKADLTLTRVFNAPRELVFKAWTDPIHLAQWWGPAMFTNPICEVDARPGGVLRIVMRGPDGSDYPMGGIFQEVIDSELLVFTNIATDRGGSHLLEGITKVYFADEGTGTKLTVETSMQGLVEYADQMLNGMEAGWSQSLVCLDEHLADKAEPVIVERTFNAPVEIVWKALTNKEDITKWSFQVSDFEPEVGFKFQFSVNKEGVEYTHCCVVTEVIPLKRLEYSWRYEGYEGDSTVNIELFAENDTTKVRLVHRGIETFGATEGFARNNFLQGWTHIIGSLLKDYVEQQKNS